MGEKQKTVNESLASIEEQIFQSKQRMKSENKFERTEASKTLRSLEIVKKRLKNMKDKK